MKSTLAGLVYLLTIAMGWSVQRRQHGPVDPSTDPNCNYYDDAIGTSNNCAYFEDFWGISHADFVSWNPSVKNDCSGIKIGNSYCVEVIRNPTPTSSATISPSSTKTSRPSPVQSGVIESCTTWYKAITDDDCTKISRKFGTFSVAEFIKWNPAVGAACRDLLADTYYCTGIPGTPTAPITTVIKPTSSSTGIPKPSPTQDGLIESCQKFYLAIKDDTCAKIVKQYNTFTLKDFVSWNPAVGDDCRQLQENVYYCVGIPGTPTAPPATSTSPTSSPGNGISTPLPTQPGMVKNCDAFYFVNANEGCQNIANKHGITLAQFLAWNPEAGSNCGGLWAEAYACVSIIGHTPSKPGTTTTSKTSASTLPTGCTISHPEPTQGGSICNCKQWYLPAKNEYCADIEKKFGITATQFRTQWNPTIGTSCGSMWAASYVCVKG